jgi:ubiquinone/menaquinone biosynthesis C-methylase UbiE
MTPRACLVVALLLACMAGAADLPPAPTHYMGRRIAVTMHYTGAPWLMRPSRDREEGTRLMLAQLEARLQPGWSVCDLGCGNGFYTLPMARRVGDKGVVYAVDIQPQMIELLKERLTDEKLPQVKPIVNTAVDTGLPPDSCDLILLVDVYHEFSHPEPMLASIRKALKKTGVVALVEFRAEDDKVPIKPEHKMSKAQIRKEWEANGFQVAEEYDGLPWQHVVYLKRRDAEAESK